MSATRIWIDSDPALAYVEDGSPKDVDDAYPIASAIADPGVDLAGISTVFGNSPAEVGFRIASDLVRLAGADLPVVKGAAEPGDPAHGFERNDAASAMAAALRAGPLSIVAIGPLTNVAALIEHFPDEAGRIDEVVVVAGRSVDQVFELDGAGGIPDFNFESDPHAGRVLMGSPVPTALTGFELTSQVVLTRDSLEALRGRGKLADAIVQGSLPWLDWWTGVFPSDAGFHPWDSAALAYLLHPEWFARERRGWRIRPQPHTAPGGPGAPGTPWLELGVDLAGEPATYCPGFQGDGAKRFIEWIFDSLPEGPGGS